MFEVFGQPRPSNFPIGNLNATISQDIKKYPVNVTMAIDAVDIDIWVKCTSIYSIISVEQIKNNATLDFTILLGVAAINAAGTNWRSSEIAKGIPTSFFDNALKASNPVALNNPSKFYSENVMFCAQKGMSVIEKLKR
jgi:hypothetical protein